MQLKAQQRAGISLSVTCNMRHRHQNIPVPVAPHGGETAGIDTEQRNYVILVQQNKGTLVEDFEEQEQVGCQKIFLF